MTSPNGPGAKRPRRLVIASAALLLLLLSPLVAGCGDGSSSRRSVSARLELALGSAHRSGVPPALVVGQLDPGTYSTTRFVPRVSFSLGDGWNLLTETPGEVALSRGPLSFTPTQLRFVSLRRAWQLTPPFVSDTDTLRDWRPRSHRAPVDYLAYVSSLTEELHAEAAADMVIGGRAARAMQYTVLRAPSSLPGTCVDDPGPCFAPPTGIWLDYVSLPPGSTVRIAVVGSDHGPLLVEAAAPDSAQLDSLLADAVPLLASSKIG